MLGDAVRTSGPTPVSSSRAHYEAHIDGLRAGAVVRVVIYHAFPDSLTGGFVGVDVFFVISGFLITSVILRDLDGRGFGRPSCNSQRSGPGH